MLSFVISSYKQGKIADVSDIQVHHHQMTLVEFGVGPSSLAELTLWRSNRHTYRQTAQHAQFL